MGSFNVNPTTILSKIHVRTPTQAESLSSRYSFLNLNNAEPNLGKPPGIFGGTYYSTLTSDEYLGIRYALLSNNHSGSAWRVWAYDNPRIAAYSKEGSLGIGDNAYPLNIKSFVYSNYAFDNQNNRYNSQSFSNKTFNVFALSGIYLFDSTTIGDPASAIAFIVTDEGNVGIGTEDPAERLTVNGNISANGSLFVKDLSANNLTVSGNISASGNLAINGNTVLGDTTNDETIIRGTVKIADSDSDAIVFGTNNGSYDTNLYRSAANILKTDDSFIVEGDTFLNGNVALGDSTSDVITFSGAPVRFPNAFNAANALKIGNDVNLFRSAAGSLQINDNLIVTNTLNVNGVGTFSNNVKVNSNLSAGFIDIKNLTGVSTVLTSATASGEFLLININGSNKAIRLWDY